MAATDDTIFPVQSPGKAKQARMWVYVGDPDHPYNVFDFTLNRGRDGPKQFLKDYTEVLLADAYGGYYGVVAGNGITCAGCMKLMRDGSSSTLQKTAPEIRARGDSPDGQALCHREPGPEVSVSERLDILGRAVGSGAGRAAAETAPVEEQLLPKHPMAEAVNYTLRQWAELTVVPLDGRGAHRQQREPVDEADCVEPEQILFVGQLAQGAYSNPGQPRPGFAADTPIRSCISRSCW